jgi:hypothetical protein
MRAAAVGFKLQKALLSLHIGIGGLFVARKKWWSYLDENLTFPFEGIVDEGQDGGPLDYGDRLKIHEIENEDSLYGILVNVRHGRRKYVFPLCDIAVVDTESANYKFVDEYKEWFSNR